jgi:hypothetical protein
MGFLRPRPVGDLTLCHSTPKRLFPFITVAVAEKSRQPIHAGTDATHGITVGLS